METLKKIEAWGILKLDKACRVELSKACCRARNLVSLGASFLVPCPRWNVHTNRFTKLRKNSQARHSKLNGQKWFKGGRIPDAIHKKRNNG